MMHAKHIFQLQGTQFVRSWARVHNLGLGGSCGSVLSDRAQLTAYQQTRRSAVVAPPAFPHQPLPGSAAPPQVLADKTVAVVGGGLGGLLCAAHLARLGATVEVFEQYDSSAVDRSKQPPKLSAKAKAAIEAAGLSAEFGPQWRSEGISHQSAAPKAASSIPALVSLLSPIALVAHLREECERVYGAAVAVTHGMRAVEGDVCSGELVLEDGGGQRHERRVDMVVGADGAASTVRGLMRKDGSDMGVLSFNGHWGLVCAEVQVAGDPGALMTPSGEPSTEVPDVSDMLPHECMRKEVQPDRGQRLFSRAAINVMHGGAEVLLTVVGQAEWLTWTRPKAGVLEALEEAYPQLPKQWLDDMAQHIHTNSLAEDPLALIRRHTFLLSITLACGRAVLLGDAAHCMSYFPAFKHADLRDCGTLAHACILADGDIEECGKQYDDALYDYADTLSTAAEKVGLFDSFASTTLLYDAVIRPHNTSGEFIIYR